MARYFDPDDERLVWELGPEQWFDDEDKADLLTGTAERPEQLPDDWDGAYEHAWDDEAEDDDAGDDHDDLFGEFDDENRGEE